MTQRVVVVDGTTQSAEALSRLITGTYAGIAALCYGLYWLIARFTPPLLAGDIGLLTYLVAPLAIIFSAFLLIAIVGAAISLHDPITQLLYAALSSYLLVPMMKRAEWLGHSEAGIWIAYLLVFLLVTAAVRLLMARRQILKLAQAAAAIGALSILYLPFWESTQRIILAAGWWR